MPPYPLEYVPRSVRRRVFAGLLLLALATMAALSAIDASLRTPATPYGIVSFELCAWNHGFPPAIAAYRTVPLPLGMSLGLDYLFMPVYAAGLGAGLVFTAASRSERARVIARWLAWACALAACLDAIENAALWHIVRRGEATTALAWTATGPATLKLAIIAVALLGWLGLGIARRTA